MQLEPDQFWTLYEWLFEQGGLFNAGFLIISLCVVGFAFSYVVSVFRSGPVEGFYDVAKVIGQFFTVDLPGTSIRRVGAIAKLAIKEALRRRVFTIVGLFIIALMFAGLFMQNTAEHRARLFIIVVMSGTNYLILLTGLFVSAFSLPDEIKNKTIYSIVTKPVRPTEIILGRVFGFGIVGTVLLAVLGLLSYVFVVKGLEHTHSIEEITGSGLVGELSKDGGHSHEFEIDPETGEGFSTVSSDHRHLVTRVNDSAENPEFVVGPPSGELGAIIPMYGSLQFYDKAGNPSAGKSVGEINKYRRYIAGGTTLESGVWTFDNVTPANFENGLKIEMRIYAFRTFKGDIKTGVRGELILRNPDGSAETEGLEFIIDEGELDQKIIPVQSSGRIDGKAATVDLFDDLAPDGKIQVVLRCRDQGQYFGMARGDLTLRAGERPFAWNFFKGYVSIWLQLMIVICFGVMFSTFLSGPVALVATVTTIVLGFFGSVFSEVIQGTLEGGGPIETSVRMVTQAGVVNEFDIGNPIAERIIQTIDNNVMQALSVATSALPNFGELETSEFVAYQINIFSGLISRHLLIGVGYFLLTTIVGYFFLKTREMAA
jgi:ABC-type transport system involved in multi-copper enzyme maturation permease subunit